jgi:hypothetical protein
MEILRNETPRKKYTYALGFTCELMSSVVQNEMVESEVFGGRFHWNEADHRCDMFRWELAGEVIRIRVGA